MTRSEMREHVFKLVFRAEFFQKEEMDSQIALYMESLPDAGDAEKEYIAGRVSEILMNLSGLDAEISRVATGCKIERMGKVEVALLRLACFEIQCDEDIPVGVAINEAVELAKRYGGEQSGRFVNAILAKLI